MLPGEKEWPSLWRGELLSSPGGMPGPPLVVPGVGANAPAEQVNVTMGCSDHDSCEDTPCQSRGRCISQGWRGYTCECHRPYEGAECQEEYITAHFGKEDSESYAVFSADEGLSQSIIMSLFIRTRHTHGLLLVMANSTSQYLHIWIHDGKVKLQINNSDILVSRGVVNDGHFHLVTVKVDEGMVEMILSAQNQGNIPIQSVCMQPGDLVYVGGLPDHRATAAYGGYFKGCIQDLRVNSKRLQFYPLGSPVMSYSLERLVKVTRGCAGDNSCSTNPCLNGGVCYSIWDDFTCKCPLNVTGRRCEQVKWCELLPCPPNAVCQSQAQGFQCVSNVTLQENSPIITFKSNGKIQRQLSSITMQFRTSASDATLLHAETASDFITISIQDFYMVLELQAGEASPKLSSESQVPVSDGQWHTLHLSMQDPTLQASEWTMILDGDQEKLVTSTTASGDLNFLKEGVDILVGGLGTEVGGDLVGCLGLVEIGGLLLPFYNDSETNLPRPQEERFIRTSGPPQYGCLGSDVCESEPCEHGGVCIDLFDRFNCNCPAGWRGSRCEETADVCASKPCVHGNCILLSEGYECVCDPEYEGKHCQMQADACARNECGQGATCLRGFARYACLCPQNTTGPFCTYPKLPVSVCGTERLNYSCFNGGNCSLAEDGCDCMPGFTGHW
uniref:Uncharacterized protein n=1 Tax=Denticeps clupeoides TaxID=299321 RepID=A0AAY4A7I7_9TELE